MATAVLVLDGGVVSQLLSAGRPRRTSIFVVAGLGKVSYPANLLALQEGCIGNALQLLRLVCWTPSICVVDHIRQAEHRRHTRLARKCLIISSTWLLRIKLEDLQVLMVARVEISEAERCLSAAGSHGYFALMDDSSRPANSGIRPAKGGRGLQLPT